MKNRSKTILCSALSILIVLIMCTAPLAFLLTPVSSNAAEVPVIDSKLPEIHINTDSGKNPGRDDNVDYFAGNMRIKLNDYYSECTSECTGDSPVAMGIRTRGNSTRTFAGAVSTGKFSYKIKLDKKEDLFGMGASKHWILLSNIYDPTYMRNKTAYEMARALGLTYCDSTWVVLYLNGEYRGLYQFCESIRVSKNRVDITDWDDIIDDITSEIAKKNSLSKEEKSALKDGLETDMSWVSTGYYKNYKISDYYDGTLDIKSGYIVEYDSFDNQKDTRPFIFKNKTTPAGVMLKVDTPEYYYTNDSMLEYVRTLITDFENAVTSPTFYNSKGKHYSEYCDLDSLVNFFVLQMAVKNGEFGIRSMFFYIEDGKIYWGPVWDFDCGAGNHLTVDTDAGGWNGGGNRNQWYHVLYGDPYFTTLVQQRYADVRDTLRAAADAVEIYRGYIEKEAKRDLDKYGPHGFNTMSGNVTKSFKEEYDFYYSWQKRRLDWLDSNLLVRYPNIGGEGPYNSEKLKFTLTANNGRQLEKDQLTLYGIKADHLCPTDNGKGQDIKFNVSTTHTTCASIGIYVNGVYRKTLSLSMNSPASGTISADWLCFEKNAVNTVYIVVYNTNDHIYNGGFFTVRISDENNRASGQTAVQFNESRRVVNTGEQIVFPEVTRKQEGMKFAGWTDGSTTFTEKTKTLTVNKSTAFYEKWTHTDGLAVLEARKTPIILGNTVVNGGSFDFPEIHLVSETVQPDDPVDPPAPDDDPTDPPAPDDDPVDPPAPDDDPADPPAPDDDPADPPAPDDDPVDPPAPDDDPVDPPAPDDPADPPAPDDDPVDPPPSGQDDDGAKDATLTSDRPQDTPDPSFPGIFPGDDEGVELPDIPIGPGGIITNTAKPEPSSSPSASPSDPGDYGKNSLDTSSTVILSILGVVVLGSAAAIFFVFKKKK